MRRATEAAAQIAATSPAASPSRCRAAAIRSTSMSNARYVRVACGSITGGPVGLLPRVGGDQLRQGPERLLEKGLQRSSDASSI